MVDLKKSLSQLASERDAAAAAQQQRLAFLEAQAKRDQDELERCKAQLADAYVAAAGDRAAADKRHSVLDAQCKNAIDEVERLRKQLDAVQTSR